MINYFIISTEGSYFSIFYNLAFFVALIILLYEGYSRKFPMLKWILLLALTKLLFITGSKIVTYSPEEWYYLFTNLSFPPTLQKSLFGGLMLGSIGLIAGNYLFRFRQNFMDTFAVALPLAIAIQRIGCFLTGCCFGKITQVPWAVKYPINTLPHYHQFQNGLISFHDVVSLPVHPVQLYDLIGGLIVVLLVVKFRKYFKIQGSLLLFSLLLVIVLRFITEFFRDPFPHTIGGGTFWIFSITQWAILPIAFLLFFILKMRESKNLPLTHPLNNDDLDLASSFALLAAYTSLLWLLRNWFSFSEMSALITDILVVISLMGYRFIQNYYKSPYRWLYFAFLTLPLVLMAQTFPDNKPDSALVKTYKSIKIGFATGNYQNSNDIGTGEGCDRVSNTEYFEQKYTLAGAGFSITKEKPELEQSMTYGIKAFIGQHNETRLSDNNQKKTFLIGITPYINYDERWYGFGGGLNIGNLSFTTENLSKDGTGTPKSGSIYTPVYPQLYLRVGRLDWVFADYHLADYFPSALPGFRQQLGIGTGFGSKSGLNARFGTTFAGSYFSAYLPIENKVVLEPLFIWGNSPQMDGQSQFQFSLGLSYRFNHQEGMKKRIPISN